MPFHQQIAIEIVLGLLVGTAVFIFLLKKPEHFVTTLIATSMFTLGFIQGRGYSFLDKALLGSEILAMGANLIRKKFTLEWKRVKTLEFGIVSAFLAYFSLHALTTAILQREFLLLYWTLFYALIWIAYAFASLGNFPRPHQDRITLTVVWSGVAYLAAYLLHWVVVELIFWRNWEYTQSMTWVGTSYATFAIGFMLPFVILMLTENKRQWDRLGVFAVIIASLVGNVYGSRAALIAIAVGILISFFLLHFRKWLLVLMCWVVFGFGNVRLITKQLGLTAWFLGNIEMMGDSSMFLLFPRDSDSDRSDHFRAALRILFEKPDLKSFFGLGEEAHKRELKNAPEILRHFVGRKDTPSVVRSSAWVANMINHGILGLALLMGVLLMQLRLIYQMPLPHRLVFVPCLGLILLWGFITDYRGMVLVYLALFGLYSHFDGGNERARTEVLC